MARDNASQNASQSLVGVTELFVVRLHTFKYFEFKSQIYATEFELP